MAKADPKTKPPPILAPGYLHTSQRPLQSLLFLLPLIVLYEVGTIFFATDHARGVTRFIYARSLLRDFFELLGATGYYLPGFIVVVVLLCWHLARKDPWKVDTNVCLGMWLESIALALPLFVFGLVLFRHVDPGAVVLGRGFDDTNWPQKLVFSVGAGIYEELLFRLIAIALVHMVLVDVLALPARFGAAAAIVLSALAFSLYHFSAENPFEWGKALFYFGAGVYFAAVYVARGFGIVAGTHAHYDVLVVLLQWLQR